MRIWLNRIVFIAVILVLLVGGVGAAWFLVGLARQGNESAIKGLHDIRTGEKVADALAALRYGGEGIQFYYIVYFNPDCGACNEHTPNVIRAWAEMVTTQYGHRFGVVFILAGEKSDKELLAWADEYDMPQDIPILNGASAGNTGLPKKLNTADGANANPEGVPATFLVYQMTDGEWWTMGAAMGPIDVEFLVGIAMEYFMWRDMQGG